MQIDLSYFALQNIIALYPSLGMSYLLVDGFNGDKKTTISTAYKEWCQQNPSSQGLGTEHPQQSEHEWQALLDEIRIHEDSLITQLPKMRSKSEVSRLYVVAAGRRSPGECW